MSQPPESVQIGPYQYRVILETPEQLGDAAHNENAVTLGTANHQDQTITLEPQQTFIGIRDSLLHETLHGVFNLTAQIEGDEEERIVCMLSSLLLDTLRRNPDLVAYLTSEDAG